MDRAPVVVARAQQVPPQALRRVRHAEPARPLRLDVLLHAEPPRPQVPGRHQRAQGVRPLPVVLGQHQRRVRRPLVPQKVVPRLPDRLLRRPEVLHQERPQARLHQLGDPVGPAQVRQPVVHRRLQVRPELGLERQPQRQPRQPEPRVLPRRRVPLQGPPAGAVQLVQRERLLGLLVLLSGLGHGGGRGPAVLLRALLLGLPLLRLVVVLQRPHELGPQVAQVRHVRVHVRHKVLRRLVPPERDPRQPDDVQPLQRHVPQRRLRVRPPQPLQDLLLHDPADLERDLEQIEQRVPPQLPAGLVPVVVGAPDLGLVQPEVLERHEPRHLLPDQRHLLAPRQQRLVHHPLGRVPQEVVLDVPQHVPVPRPRHHQHRHQLPVLLPVVPVDRPREPQPQLERRDLHHRVLRARVVPPPLAHDLVHVHLVRLQPAPRAPARRVVRLVPHQVRDLHLLPALLAQLHAPRRHRKVPQVLHVRRQHVEEVQERLQRLRDLRHALLAERPAPAVRLVHQQRGRLPLQRRPALGHRVHREHPVPRQPHELLPEELRRDHAARAQQGLRDRRPVPLLRRRVRRLHGVAHEIVGIHLVLVLGAGVFWRILIFQTAALGRLVVAVRFRS